jgi:hypothetical protein
MKCDLWDRGVWMRRLRVTIFLTCLTSIVSTYGYLDGVDALALKFLPSGEAGQQEQHVGLKLDTVVLGITSDFFNAEFGGRTPIDRDQFQALIVKTLQSYPSAKVIAIDYDFSPSIPQHCTQDDSTEFCEFASLEAKQQARFDKFLTQDLKRLLGDRRISIVLISPLPTSEESVPGKQAWQRKLANAGIRFGDYSLLSHDWFGTVVKHIPTRSLVNPCSTIEDVRRPFASVVNDAGYCIPKSESKVQLDIEVSENVLTQRHQVALINFIEAQKAVFYCPLWEWSDVTQNCQRRLNLASSDPNQISTVFIGASYGQEDRFRTPLGDLYGIVLHAYSAYTLRHPVAEEHEFRFVAFIGAIVFGVLSASIFDCLWKYAASYPKYSTRRLFIISAVSALLFGLVWCAIFLMPFMLTNSVWMNPLLIVFGSFIDSYQASMEQSSTSEKNGSYKSSWLELWGSLGERKRLVTIVGLKTCQGKIWLQFIRRIVFYWFVVGWCVYHLFIS